MATTPCTLTSGRLELRSSFLSVDPSDAQEHGESFRWQLCRRGRQSAADASNPLQDIGLPGSRGCCGHRLPTILAVCCLAAALGYVAVGRKMTTPQEIGLHGVIAAFEPFVRAEGRNCYLGHGATPLDHQNMAGITTLQSCQELCAANWECEGIVFARDQEQAECWVRKNIHLDQCVVSYSWDAYLKPSASQEPATTTAPQPATQDAKTVNIANGISASFVHHPGYNCWSGHGATPLPAKGEFAGLTLEQCHQECAAFPDCQAAIVVPNVERGSCWLYTNLAIVECRQHSSWDLWARAGTPLAATPAPAPPPPPPAPPSFAPSSAPLFEFYQYRATKDGDIARYPVGNMNTANLDGLMWYLLNEVVTNYSSGPRCPRKFDISKIHRFKVKYRAPDILLTEKQHFGVRYAYDFGECQGRCFADNHCTSEADCSWHYNKYGYILGCNRFDDKYPWPNFDTAAPQGVWYSLPLEGRCNGIPTGTRQCTWSYEDAGFVTLKDLEGTTPGDHDCCEGSCSNYWDDEYVPGATLDRVSKALDVFYNKYPELPKNLDEPKCDFDKDSWYSVDEWPRVDPWAPS